MGILTKVEVTNFAEKQLSRVPEWVSQAFRGWVESVQFHGIREVRKIPGYHDEPLKGRRRGERSIRLNRSYRAIYVETIEGIEITVIEVNKHDY